MKKYVMFLLGLLFGYYCLFSQTLELFYYYKGNQISLPINNQHFFVYADANKISNELFAKEYRVTEWIENGSNGVIEVKKS